MLFEKMSELSDISPQNRKNMDNSGNESFGETLSALRRSIGSDINNSAEGDGQNLCDGCIILGQKSLSGNKYITRYRIDREEQNKEVQNEILCETFCPMIPAREEGASCGKLTWLFFSSEPFLLSLHITVLILGVLKEALDLRTVDEDLHFVHSVLETFVAVMQIAIRIVSAWTKLRDLKQFRTSTEYIAPERKSTLYGHQKGWVIMSTILGVSLILFAIAAFLIFMFFAHLGWTILSNNFVLVVGVIVFAVVIERLTLTKESGIKDQHKAVLYETLLLFAEMAWAKTPQDQKLIQNKVERFGKALQDTAIFAKPGHIFCDDAPRMGLLATMQMQSMV